MSLTDVEIRQMKPVGKPTKIGAGGGLYLFVSPPNTTNPKGSKLWRLKYRFGGLEKTFSIGAYPAISLANALKAAQAAKDKLRVGIDPMAEKHAEKAAKALQGATTFERVARSWWENWKGNKSARHVDTVIRRLEADVFPKIGARPINDIQPMEIKNLLKAMEARGVTDLAKRARETVGQVFRFAIADGLCTANPAAILKPADILKPTTSKNQARIDAKELPDLLRRIEAYEGASITRIAMKLMAMTFVRTSELIAARWSEIDLYAARWDIPAERMKMRTPHIVPLSTQAVEQLRVLRLVSGHGSLLFPGERDHEKPMSNNTILKALERMGYKGRMTGHGFRGLASTQLHEMGFRHDHIEIQLAHQERNRVSASYNHATYLADRTQMMQHWSDYLESCTTGKVLAFKAKRA